MRNPIWSIEEIHEKPEFGGEVGWFYGLVWFEGRLHLGEIFPGLGFAPALDRYNFYDPKVYLWIMKDIWWAARR